MRWTINVVLPPVLGETKSGLKGMASAILNFDCLTMNSLDLMVLLKLIQMMEP
jgi:hypothetical protein